MSTFLFPALFFAWFGILIPQLVPTSLYVSFDDICNNQWPISSDILYLVRPWLVVCRCGDREAGPVTMLHFLQPREFGMMQRHSQTKSPTRSLR